MRKELLVYVPTIEKGEEISVTAVSSNRSYVLINTPNGKVTANREELLSSLLSIEEFDKANNPILVVEKVNPFTIVDDVEYLTEEEDQ